MFKLIGAIVILVIFGFVFILCSERLNNYAQKGYKKNLQVTGLTNTIFDKPPAEWQFKTLGFVLLAFAFVMILIVVFKR